MITAHPSYVYLYNIYSYLFPFRCRYSARVPWLLSFLGHTQAAARTAAARLLGSHVATALTAEAAAVSGRASVLPVQ